MGQDSVDNAGCGWIQISAKQRKLVGRRSEVLFVQFLNQNNQTPLEILSPECEEIRHRLIRHGDDKTESQHDYCHANEHIEIDQHLRTSFCLFDGRVSSTFEGVSSYSCRKIR